MTRNGVMVGLHRRSLVSTTDQEVLGVGIFAMRRSALPAAPETRAEPSGPGTGVPIGFVAVGEALASEADPSDACAVAGRELALAGVSLDEALMGLESTFRSVHGTSPAFAATRALATAWSEATLGYLHQLGCADPVTGLATLAHLQSRLPELYRGGLRGRPRPHASHALVVVDLAPAGVADLLSADLRIARVAETTATVFAAGEPVARMGRDRLVVLADRDDRIGRRVALLGQLLAAGAGQPGARIWIEGLPDTGASAAALLADLVRV